MATKKERALEVIEEKKALLWPMSDTLWDHPETGFHERYAAELYGKMLEQEGFQVERELAGIPTAFSGTYGQGGPVIGFLGEFDALPGLSPAAGADEKRPVEENGPGHGCGHNLLGVGSLAAAIALKHYLQDSGLPGTVKFFGCPAEENGSGKGFMAPFYFMLLGRERRRLDKPGKKGVPTRQTKKRTNVIPRMQYREVEI